MPDIALKQQAVPLLLLVLLLIAAVVSTGAQRRLKDERRVFSIEHYDRLMHRIDEAIGSISDTMIEEGMAADFEELLRRAKTEISTERVSPLVRDERVPLTLTGIVWNPSMPLAFVNGATVGKGDRIGDAEIVAIDRTSIRVRYPDQAEQTLSLAPEEE